VGAQARFVKARFMKQLRWVLLALGLACFVQGTWIYGKALVAQVLLSRAWAAARGGDDRARPWPWADTWPVLRLSSPAHDVDLIVLEGAAGSSLAFGPGRIASSARPGHAGNLALAGHRDTHFEFLRDVAEGDPLWVELPNGRSVRYEVSAIAIVDQRDVSWLERSGEWLTLVTCYPFNSPVVGGPLRYIVQARPS
jgi:sortase A